MARAPWRARRPASQGAQPEPESLHDGGDVQRAYDQYGGEIFGFVYKAVQDWQQAEDIVQEVFVKAWRASFDPDKASLRTWLFSIARNTVADALRHRTVRQNAGLDDFQGDPQGEGLAEPDPMDWLLERIQLDEALGRLSPDHRQAVVEVYFGGKTCVEIGRELGISASTVRSRLYYGVRTLRLVLEENGWLAP